jgi:hypothetical protein
MKIYVLKGKKVFSVIMVLLIIASTVFVATICRPAVAYVFSTDKDLPIYSVDYPEKKVAITFDCAWEAGK